MPLLGALITSLFGGLAGFLVKLFAARLAGRLAAVAAVVAAGGVLMVTFNAFVAPLLAQVFSTEYGQLLGLIFPPVAGTCIAAVTAVGLACATYKLQVKAVTMVSGS